MRKIFKVLLRWFRRLISPLGRREIIDISAAAALRTQSEPAEVVSSWDDLLEGGKTAKEWKKHKEVLRQRYLELIRDEAKPAKVPLDVKIHESVVVDEVYTRQLISYNVEADERTRAYLGIPLNRNGRVPGVVALHSTVERGKEQMAGLVGGSDKAHLDKLARRGYVVIAPDHFTAGDRVPAGQWYETEWFYRKHPQWSAVGKFTYENAIAVDVLESLEEVDPNRLGALGHSLGGHSTYFLSAYDERIKAAACNCGAGTFRHNPQVGEWARDHWYVYFQHLRPILQSGYLPPIDMHEIIALIAPRAFLDISGMNDGDGRTQRQRVLMNMKIMAVYELEKASENFAFYVHGQGHAVHHDAHTLMYAWLDKHLK